MDRLKRIVNLVRDGKDIWVIDGVRFNTLCDLCKSQAPFARVLVSLVNDSNLVICSTCFDSSMEIFIGEPPLVISKL